MASDAEVLSLARQAISDPGAFTPRQLREGRPGSGYESVPQWGARAVLVALERAGLAVVPAAVEWGVRYADWGGRVVPHHGRADAIAARDDVAERKPDAAPVLVWREKERPAGPWNEEDRADGEQ